MVRDIVCMLHDELLSLYQDNDILLYVIMLELKMLSCHYCDIVKITITLSFLIFYNIMLILLPLKDTVITDNSDIICPLVTPIPHRLSLQYQ
jgi:hypothetical protein